MGGGGRLPAPVECPLGRLGRSLMRSIGLPHLARGGRSRALVGYRRDRFSRFRSQYSAVQACSRVASHCRTLRRE
jgi:hypothetical protein